jgi:hypothetical protein
MSDPLRSRELNLITSERLANIGSGSMAVQIIDSEREVTVLLSWDQSAHGGGVLD